MTGTGADTLTLNPSIPGHYYNTFLKWDNRSARCYFLSKPDRFRFILRNGGC